MISELNHIDAASLEWTIRSDGSCRAVIERPYYHLSIITHDYAARFVLIGEKQNVRVVSFVTESIIQEGDIQDIGIAVEYLGETNDRRRVILRVEYFRDK